MIICSTVSSNRGSSLPESQNANQPSNQLLSPKEFLKNSSFVKILPLPNMDTLLESLKTVEASSLSSTEFGCLCFKKLFNISDSVNTFNEQCLNALFEFQLREIQIDRLQREFKQTSDDLSQLHGNIKLEKKKMVGIMMSKEREIESLQQALAEIADFDQLKQDLLKVTEENLRIRNRLEHQSYVIKMLRNNGSEDSALASKLSSEKYCLDSSFNNSDANRKSQDFNRQLEAYALKACTLKSQLEKLEGELGEAEAALQQSTVELRKFSLSGMAALSQESTWKSSFDSMLGQIERLKTAVISLRKEKERVKEELRENNELLEKTEEQLKKLPADSRFNERFAKKTPAFDTQFRPEVNYFSLDRQQSKGLTSSVDKNKSPFSTSKPKKREIEIHMRPKSLLSRSKFKSMDVRLEKNPEEQTLYRNENSRIQQTPPNSSFVKQRLKPLLHLSTKIRTLSENSLQLLSIKMKRVLLKLSDVQRLVSNQSDYLNLPKVTISPSSPTEHERISYNKSQLTINELKRLCLLFESNSSQQNDSLLLKLKAMMDTPQNELLKKLSEHTKKQTYSGHIEHRRTEVSREYGKGGLRNRSNNFDRMFQMMQNSLVDKKKGL